MTIMEKPMPLYVGDYLTDTAHLTTLQHGCYLLLLMVYWRGGPLPDDDVKLARICKITLTKWKREVAPVLRPFFRPSNGRLFQKRSEQERSKAMRKTEAKQLARMKQLSNKSGYLLQKMDGKQVSKSTKENLSQVFDIAQFEAGKRGVSANAENRVLEPVGGDPGFPEIDVFSLPEDIENIGNMAGIGGVSANDAETDENGVSRACSNILLSKEERKKGRKKGSITPIIPFEQNVLFEELKPIAKNETPEWMPMEAWDGFLVMRKKIKKPATDRAIAMLIKKLDGFRAQGADPEAILDQSTLNCWQDLYPLKQPWGTSPAKPASQAAPKKITLMDEPPAWFQFGDVIEKDGKGVERATINGHYLCLMSDEIWFAGKYRRGMNAEASVLVEWLRDGKDGADDILPAIRKVASRPGYTPPGSLRYFDSAVRNYVRTYE